MFIAQNFIYLQLQKTACTHIAKIFDKATDGFQTPAKHNYLTGRVPEKLIIGSIRNPWDWYVSLWAYGCSNRGGLWQRLNQRGMSIRQLYSYLRKHDFMSLRAEITKDIGQWQYLYSNVYNPHLFRAWLRKILRKENHVYLGEMYHKSSISSFSGFLTFRYSYMYLQDFFNGENFRKIKNLRQLIQFDRTHNLLDYVIRTENLEDDVIRILNDIGYELKPSTIEWIRSQKKTKTNKSERKDSSFYYDLDTAELVSRQEQFIIGKYDYTMPKLKS